MKSVLIRLHVVLFAVCLLPLEGANDSECDPLCINHYRNCDPAGDLPPDRDITIDCEKLHFKLKCPVFCEICTPCTGGDLAALEDRMDQFENQLNELEHLFANSVGCDSNTDCQNGGQCSDGTCECPVGVSGFHCESDQDECSMEDGASLCGGESSCYNTLGSYECRCNEEGQAYNHGSCGEAAELTNIVLSKPGTGPGHVTITLKDDKGDNCVVTADVSKSGGGALSEIHGLMDSIQASSGGENTMDGDATTQFELSAGLKIQYYIDTSIVSTVQYLSTDTSTSGMQVKVCDYEHAAPTVNDVNCRNCEASLLISLDGWKEAKCDMDGDVVQLYASATTYLQEVEIMATSKFGLELLGVSSVSSSSEYSMYAPASVTVQRNYDGRWAPSGNRCCFASEGGSESNPWVRYVLQGTATVHRVKFLNRFDCCPERLVDHEVWVCDNGNCEYCGQTPAESVGVAFESVTCSTPLKGDSLEVRKSGEGYMLQYCEIDIYGECEADDCQLELFASSKSMTSVSDALCTKILAGDGTTLKSAIVQFDGQSTDAEWSFKEISLKFNGADYKVTDNSETTFSNATPSKSYNL